MNKGPGWWNEPMRHSLAARGIPTQQIFHRGRTRGPLTDEEKEYEQWLKSPWLQENYSSYEEYKKWKSNYATSKQQGYTDPQGNTAHDKIFEMVRENTGSHMLDSGGAYGYIYNSPISKDGLIWDDWMGYSISLPHFLDAFLSFNENTDKFNEILDNHIKTVDNNSYFEDAHDIVGVIKVLAEKEGVDFRAHSVYNTCNYENDLDQVYQAQHFRYDGETYIIFMSHNGCDVRGGYSRPHIFHIDGDEDYFMDDRIRYYGGECPGPTSYDPSTTQTTIEGREIRIYPEEADWETAWEYTSAWDKSKFLKDLRRGDDWERYRDPESGALRCPLCGEYHIDVYNPGLDGY